MKNTFKLLAFGVLLLLVLVGGLFLLQPTFADDLFHLEEAGIRMEVHNANVYVNKRAGQIEQHTFKQTAKYTENGDIVPAKWFGVAMDAANNVRDDRRMRAAAIARAKDEDERIPQAEVWGNQTDWKGVAEIRVPTRITVSPADEITPPFRPDEKTNADGRPFDPVRHEWDQTVLMKERADNKLPMTNTGNTDELIGRFYYDNRSYSLGFPLGTDSVVCAGPGLHDGGIFQAWRNGFAVMDRTPMSLDFANTPGKFVLKIVPDDPANGQTYATKVCAANPGKLMVRH